MQFGFGELPKTAHGFFYFTAGGLAALSFNPLNRIFFGGESHFLWASVAVMAGLILQGKIKPNVESAVILILDFGIGLGLECSF